LSAADIFITVAIIAVLCVITIAANYADRSRSASTRRSVFAALLLINGLIVMVYGVLQVAAAYSSSEDAPKKSDAWISFAVAIVMATATTALMSRAVRERLGRFFPRGSAAVQEHRAVVLTPEQFKVPNADSAGTPLFPQMLNYYTAETRQQAEGTQIWNIPSARSSILAQTGPYGFNPASLVHMLALVFICYLIGNTIVNFVLGGGLSGVAEEYSTSGLTSTDLLLNMLPMVVLPVAGVGLGIRRNGRQVLDRLGLKLPTLDGLGMGIGAAIGLIIFATIMAALWQTLVSPETFEQQTEASEALTNSVTTIGLAFLVAATAAIGEEIAFRGAMQPIFGFWPTALIFALTHIQYTLTPASLIILGVALVFGWLRARYNTSVAMIAHFLYDFIPLALFVVYPDAVLLLHLH
jgi:membrane protease YdiL (CAAX protease family)